MVLLDNCHGLSSSFITFTQGLSLPFISFTQGLSYSFINFTQGLSSSFIGFTQGLSSSFISFTQGAGQWDGYVPALGGCRRPGGVSAGPGMVEAARRELCRPWEGVGPTRMLVLIGPLLLEHNYEIQYYHVHALCQINVAIIVHIYTIKLGTPALAIGLVERCKGIERWDFHLLISMICMPVLILFVTKNRFKHFK